jgi:hypothetical protein
MKNEVIDFFKKIPALDSPVLISEEEKYWSIDFTIDLDHEIVWNVIQYFGYICNCGGKQGLLFLPMSPPPYLNGGPYTHMSWSILCKNLDFSLADFLQILEEYLPVPLDDFEQWKHE